MLLAFRRQAPGPGAPGPGAPGLGAPGPGGPSALHEPPALVAERAVFWAELGLVSAPGLLARIGQTLQKASASDPELEQALCLAASHVRSGCLVWPADLAAHDDPDDAWRSSRGLDAPETAQAQGARTPEPAASGGGGEHLGDSADLSDSGSDTSDEAEEERQGLSRLLRSVCPRWMLPGRLASDIAWFDHAWTRWCNRTANRCGGERPGDRANLTHETAEEGGPAELQPGLARFLPRTCPRCLLPGFGGLASYVVWLVLMGIGVPAVMLIDMFCNRADLAQNYAKMGLSDLVLPLMHAMMVLRAMLYVFAMVSLRNIATCVALDGALLTELSSPTGPRTRRHVLEAASCLGVVLIVTGASESRLRMFSREFVFVLVMRQILSFTACMSCFVLWQLSINRLDRLRNNVAEPSDTLGYWKDMTREYQAIVRLVDDTWRKTGFSTACCLLFLFDLSFAACMYAIGQAKDNIWSQLGYWLFAAKHVVIVIAGLYMFADIHSRCTSHRHAKQSLMYLGAQHLGKLPRRHVLDHFSFLKCVGTLPCGVEFATGGVVQMAWVAPLLRLTVACLPLVAALTLHIMGDAPRLTRGA